MTLMKHGLWSIVDGSETTPAGDAGQDVEWQVCRKERQSSCFGSIIVRGALFAVLAGGTRWPCCSMEGARWSVSEKIMHSWANKLELRRMLYSLKLDEGGSVQAHIKTMMEVFEGLSVVGDPISDEDRVVHLLASSPDLYGMLVTALNKYRNGLSNWTIVEWRAKYERTCQKWYIGAGRKDNANWGTRYQSAKKVFFHCGKPGRSCPLLGSSNQDGKKPSRTEQANNAELETKSSDSENDALVAGYALSASTAGNWIIDSGATSHMCNNKNQFILLSRCWRNPRSSHLAMVVHLKQ